MIKYTALYPVKLDCGTAGVSKVFQVFFFEIKACKKIYISIVFVDQLYKSFLFSLRNICKTKCFFSRYLFRQVFLSMLSHVHYKIVAILKNHPLF